MGPPPVVVNADIRFVTVDAVAILNVLVEVTEVGKVNCIDEASVVGIEPDDVDDNGEHPRKSGILTL